MLSLLISNISICKISTTLYLPKKVSFANSCRYPTHHSHLVLFTSLAIILCIQLQKKKSAVFSASHLLVFSSVILPLELRNNQKGLFFGYKMPEKEEMRFCFQPRFLSFQESTTFLNIMILITQKRGGLPFMHGACVLRAL